MATEIDAFEKEHYRRLLNELNILVKYKAEKQVKVIELDEQLKYPPENPPNFKRLLHVREPLDCKSITKKILISHDNLSFLIDFYI